MLLLAGDIGGTNTRLCLINVQESGEVGNTVKEEIIPSTSADFVSIVRSFLVRSFLGEQFHPDKACFALAGPVLENRCKMTNLPWPELSGEDLQQDLQISQVTLINDFVAIGYNIVLDQNKEFLTLQVGEPRKNAPIVIVGAGTGLGKAFAVPEGNSYRVYPSEGGHMNFAPANRDQGDLLRTLRQDAEVIDVEAIVSGSGIVTIFRFLQERFTQESGELFLSQPDPAKAIAIEAAKPDGSPLCQATMNLFVEAYGSAVGDMAVTFLPFGGLFIAGGIAAQNLSLMENGRFMEGFRKKARVLPSLIEKIPVYLVTNTLSGLIGAVQYGALKM